MPRHAASVICPTRMPVCALSVIALYVHGSLNRRQGYKA